MKMMTAEQAAKAAKGLTFEKVWAAMMKSGQRMEGYNREWKEQIKELSKNFGGFSNSPGDLTESMFRNELWKKFKDIGIPVTTQSENAKFYDQDDRARGS